MILLVDSDLAKKLNCMSYDGRTPDCAWTEQDIKIYGYHYYLMPELAIQGMEKLPEAITQPAKSWSYRNYPYLPDLTVFKDHENNS